MAKKVLLKAENKEVFSIRAIGAKSVQLVGDFTRWQKSPITLKKSAGDTWTAVVDLTPGKHEYRFIVDGEWRDDTDCKSRVPNPFGSLNSVREVSLRV